MSGKMDEVKGKVKQAAGDLSDDKDLKSEGKADETGGKVKQAADTGGWREKTVGR